MPWLYNKIQSYLFLDKNATDGSLAFMDDGITDLQKGHKSVITSKYERLEKEAQDKIEAERQNSIRKKERRAAREKRAKDQALAKFREEVEEKVVKQFDVVNVLQSNLLDIHGNYT